MAEVAVQQAKSAKEPNPTCLEIVNRFIKLPVVGSTIDTASCVYGKVKDSNMIFHWTFTKTENVVGKTFETAVEIGKPLACQCLETPVRKIDGFLCKCLDFVEDKVPCVNMPPCEIISQFYNNSKDYVDKKVTPKVENAYSYVKPAVNAAYDKIEPAVQTAKHIVEPAVGKAYSIVEPIVQPAIDRAHDLSEFAKETAERFFYNCGHCRIDGENECLLCANDNNDGAESDMAETSQQSQQ